MWKCPSSIRYQDSNPWPLGFESPPITTRPGLSPMLLSFPLLSPLYFTSSSTSSLCFKVTYYLICVSISLCFLSFYLHFFLSLSVCLSLFSLSLSLYHNTSFLFYLILSFFLSLSPQSLDHGTHTNVLTISWLSDSNASACWRYNKLCTEVDSPRNEAYPTPRLIVHLLSTPDLLQSILHLFSSTLTTKVTYWLDVVPLLIIWLILSHDQETGFNLPVTRSLTYLRRESCAFKNEFRREINFRLSGKNKKTFKNDIVNIPE